jgi:hypothetical protein
VAEALFARIDASLVLMTIESPTSCAKADPARDQRLARGNNHNVRV